MRGERIPEQLDLHALSRPGWDSDLCHMAVIPQRPWNESATGLTHPAHASAVSADIRPSRVRQTEDKGTSGPGAFSVNEPSWPGRQASHTTAGGRDAVESPLSWVPQTKSHWSRLEWVVVDGNAPAGVTVALPFLTLSMLTPCTHSVVSTRCEERCGNTSGTLNCVEVLGSALTSSLKRIWLAISRS